MEKGVWTEQLEGQLGQGSRDGTAGTEQPGRTAGKEQLGQDSLGRTVGKGQLGQDSQAGQLVKDSLDGTAGTRQPGQDRTEKSGQENCDRKVRKTDGIVKPG